MLEKVIEIIKSELNITGIDINLETRIVEDLGADSLDAVELIMALEDEFNVIVSDERAQNFKTVGDIVQYLEENK